jgi:hypothetical protein
LYSNCLPSISIFIEASHRLEIVNSYIANKTNKGYGLQDNDCWHLSIEIFMKRKLLAGLFCMLFMQFVAAESKTIYGFIEKVTLAPQNLTLSAKLDTGAKSASLYARDIKEITQNDKTYLTFTVPTKQGDIVFKQELVGDVLIKMRALEKKSNIKKKVHMRRPVVIIPMKLGNKLAYIRVNLANRKNFNYPLLLGRDAIIQFSGIIDPALKFTL